MSRSMSTLQPMVSRRSLLQAAGVGALPGMVAAGVDTKKGLGKGAAKKSCIFILCCGGPSHLDTWDLKPDAPDTIRGPYQPIPTAVPGMRINEVPAVPNVRRAEDRIADAFDEPDIRRNAPLVRPSLRQNRSDIGCVGRCFSLTAEQMVHRVEVVADVADMRH